MALHNDIGIQGEAIAVDYLINKGYSILATNWRYKKSEIDIIAQKENDLIFVEVKTRSSTFFQTPEEAVNIKKQKQIIAGANQYVKSIEDQINIRFDIIAVLCGAKTEINHVKDAFYPVL